MTIFLKKTGFRFDQSKFVQIPPIFGFTEKEVEYWLTVADEFKQQMDNKERVRIEFLTDQPDKAQP